MIGRGFRLCRPPVAVSRLSGASVSLSSRLFPPSATTASSSAAAASSSPSPAALPLSLRSLSTAPLDDEDEPVIVPDVIDDSPELVAPDAPPLEDPDESDSIPLSVAAASVSTQATYATPREAEIARLEGLMPTPPEMIADDMEWGTDEFVTTDPDDSDMPAPMFGDDIRLVPDEAIEHVAAPFDWESSDGDGGDNIYDAREEFMTPTEISRNRRRLYLKRMLEDPIAIPNRPLWPLYSAIIYNDQVQNQTSKGSEASQRVLAVVGNRHGAAGFGIGKHPEMHKATKFALRRAQRDMIAITTHNGQLYHDLIGKKNKIQVILRSVPEASAGSASSLIRLVLDFMGVKHVSAKIVGGKRRNPFTIVQALFDAFHHHQPPEDVAFKRGIRMQWMGKDRHTPRNTYPSSPKGPRHVANRRSAIR